PDEADLALLAESRHRGERLIENGRERRELDVVREEDIDDVRTKTRETLLDRCDDPPGGEVETIGEIAIVAPDLRGKDDLVALSLEELAEALLRQRTSVVGRDVEEIDPVVDRRMDRAPPLAGVDGTVVVPERSR